MSRSRSRRARGQARDRPQRTGVERLTLTGAWSGSRALGDVSRSEYIYAAVRRIACALASMPICLYRGNERLLDDPRDAMMSLRPNPQQSAYSFVLGMEMQRLTEGRAYAVKAYDGLFQLRGLIPLDPQRVTPYRDVDSGDIYYRVVREDGEAEWIHNHYVLAFAHASTNGLAGVRVTDVLRGCIEYDADVREFSLTSLKGVNRGTILEFPSEMAGERRKRATEEFLRLYRDSGGQILAIEPGMRANALSVSPIDSKIADVEAITARRVAMVYGLPEGDDPIAFLTQTMLPPVREWEQELDYKLLLPEERRTNMGYRVDMEAYLRADIVRRNEVAQSRVRCGLRTVNELRASEHLPGVPGGDVAMVSKDLAPVEMVARGATVDVSVLNGEHNAHGGATETGGGERG